MVFERRACPRTVAAAPGDLDTELNPYKTELNPRKAVPSADHASEGVTSPEPATRRTGNAPHSPPAKHTRKYPPT